MKVYNPLTAGNIDGNSNQVHDKALLRAHKSRYKTNWIKGNPEKTLFVGRLDNNTKQPTIKKFFSKFGKVKECHLVCDQVTGASKRYAFVEFYSKNDAKIACQKAHNQSIDGKVILVDFEKERILKGWRPRRLGGGFGGNKKSGQLRFGGKERPFKKVNIYLS